MFLERKTGKTEAVLNSKTQYLFHMSNISSKLLLVLTCIDAFVVTGVEVLCISLYNLPIHTAVISGIISFAAIVILTACCLRWIHAKEQQTP